MMIEKNIAAINEITVIRFMSASFSQVCLSLLDGASQQGRSLLYLVRSNDPMRLGSDVVFSDAEIRDFLRVFLKRGGGESLPATPVEGLA